MIVITADSSDKELREWLLTVDGDEVSDIRRPGRWRVESGLSPGRHTVGFDIYSPSIYKCSLAIDGQSVAFILDGSNPDKGGYEMVVTKYA